MINNKNKETLLNTPLSSLEIDKSCLKFTDTLCIYTLRDLVNCNLNTLFNRCSMKQYIGIFFHTLDRNRQKSESSITAGLT